MNRFLLLALVAASTLLNVSCSLDDVKREDNVLVLTKDNFEEATTGTTVLVEFCQFFSIVFLHFAKLILFIRRPLVWPLQSPCP